MSKYDPLALPVDESPVLAAAIQRELTRIADGIEHRFDQEASSQIQKPQEGMLRYFDANVYIPGDGFSSGEYLYVNGQWERFPPASGVYTYLPLKGFMFRYVAGTGLIPEASYNVYSFEDLADGHYRVTVAQNTMFGLDLLLTAVPIVTVAPVNKTTEGAVVAEVADFGTDVNGRYWLDIYLAEFYISGSMRTRPYILTAPERLYGVALINYIDPSAPDAPP